jgi:glycosyltransferase involved in cell wall biosynthesis
MAAIDALVLPSLAEGWGYVLAEAAAAGRLVVAYDSSSVAEVTPATEGALLLDPSDPDALSRGLAALCAMAPTERRERARRLREYARSRLGLDRMLDDFDTFFRKCLSPAP